MTYAATAENKRLRQTLFNVAFAIVAMTTIAACNGESAPSAIELSVRPGAVILVPFDQPVKGKRQRALGFVPATSSIDPRPLPQGARIVHERIALHGSGDVTGDLLVKVPDDAEGEIQFSLSAYGEGSRALGGSAAFFSTNDVAVNINIVGDAINNNPPSLAGDWSNGEETWTIRQGHAVTIEKRYANGEKSSAKHSVYPDGNGRWFLVEFGLRGSGYWLEIVEPGTLLVSHVDEEFEPVYKFARLESK